jgi:hypothetical protein
MMTNPGKIEGDRKLLFMEIWELLPRLAVCTVCAIDDCRVVDE